MDDASGSKRRQSLAEMLSSQGLGTTHTPPPTKRRLSLAEMLKQSPLAGNTVPLAAAVDAAQEAAARKAEAEEGIASSEPTAPVAAPVPLQASNEPPAPPAWQPPFAIPAPLPPQAAPRPSNGVNRYNLYARIQGKWVWQCDIHAVTHVDGMREAIAWLKPEHNAYPIRLEQDEPVAVQFSVSWQDP